jgi:hypothetical protein
MAMTESEQLVQRFLDQELSAQERVMFVVRLGRDERLRQRAIELERLVLEVGRLPRPLVPDGFVARVLERTEPARSPWHRLADLLWAPRALQWNLASAVAVAGVMSLVMGGLVAGALSWQKAFTPAGAGASAASGAAAGSPVLVRLVVVQPGARTVQAAGDFNGWNPARTPLEHVSNGAWTATIPLEPGRYEYMFVVDGQQWIGDPFAAEQNRDGFGSQNAVLEVRPPTERPL